MSNAFALSLPGHAILTQCQRFWRIRLLIRLPCEWFLKDNDLTLQLAITGRHLFLSAMLQPWESELFFLKSSCRNNLEIQVCSKSEETLILKCRAICKTTKRQQLHFCIPFFFYESQGSVRKISSPVQFQHECSIVGLLQVLPWDFFRWVFYLIFYPDSWHPICNLKWYNSGMILPCFCLLLQQAKLFQRMPFLTVTKLRKAKFCFP